MRAIATLVLALSLGCSSDPPQPVPLEIGKESCQFCRMVVSDRRFAAQIVAHGYDPLFFDDIGCLAAHLKKNEVTPDSVVFVADYREDRWVNAHDAFYFRCPGLASPMNSGIISSAPDGQTFCPPEEKVAIFGKTLPAGGKR